MVRIDTEVLTSLWQNFGVEDKCKDSTVMEDMKLGVSYSARKIGSSDYKEKNAHFETLW